MNASRARVSVSVGGAGFELWLATMGEDGELQLCEYTEDGWLTDDGEGIRGTVEMLMAKSPAFRRRVQLGGVEFEVRTERTMHFSMD